jgi:hypothetical protein
VDSNAGDFGTSSGSFTITSNTGSFSVTPTADVTTEGAETFTVSVRSGSTSGTILATSGSVTINDTSLTPATTSMSYITNSNSLSSTITIPATATTGDIAILWDYSTTTTNTVPSGWTQINTATTTSMRFTVSYRKLTAGQNGTSVTGMSGTTRKVMAIFRGNIVPTTITPTTHGAQATTATPSTQSITAGTAPYIYFSGHAASTSGGSRTWNSGSPTEISASSTNTVYGRFQIFNSGGASTTSVSMTDAGTNGMISFKISFS